MPLSVFVSSTIEDLVAERATARKSIQALGLRPIMAEHDLPAQSATPREACLAAVREADIYLGILGPSYGYVSPKSHKSATELEFDEAIKHGKPIIWMVKQCTRDEKEEDFGRRIQAFDEGFFRAGFHDTTELATAVVHALRNHADQTESRNSVRASWRRSISEVLSGEHFAQVFDTLAVACAPTADDSSLDLLQLDRDDTCAFIEQLLLFGTPALIPRESGITRSKLSDSTTFESAHANNTRERSRVRVWPSCQIMATLSVASSPQGMHDFFASHVIDERKISSGVIAAIQVARALASKFTSSDDLVVDTALVGCSERYIGVPRKRNSMSMPIASADLGHVIFSGEDSVILRGADDATNFADRTVRLFKRRFEIAGLVDRERD